MSSPPLIKITDLVISYPHRPRFYRGKTYNQVAVDNISFSIEQGETLAIVGRSGSGKTSIALAILDFVKPTAGVIEFAGAKINNLTTREYRQYRARIQPIFQDCGAALNPQMTVARAIGDGFSDRISKSQLKIQIIELMERVGLPVGLYLAYPRQLSGGQKQRVCLARALAIGAECLLLDEPFSAQDILHQAQLMALLRKLKIACNLTYLLISHDLSTVRLLADRIMVMRDGKIVETGNVSEIFQTPKNEYTRALVLKSGILSQ